MNDIQVVIKRLRGPDDAQNAYCCMTEVPTPWPAALCSCRDWLSQNLGSFVEGYHLQLNTGGVIGHIYYAPSERALFPYEIESGAVVMYCEWVQRGFQKRGLGKQLFDNFIGEMNQAGIKGILVEGTTRESQMNYQLYQTRGFQIVYESEHRKLLYYPLGKARVRVLAKESKILPRSGLPVEILIISGYMCPYDISTQLLLRQVAREFGEQVTLREVGLTPAVLDEFGVTGGFFINGQQKLWGGETEESIRQAILEEI